MATPDRSWRGAAAGMHPEAGEPRRRRSKHTTSRTSSHWPNPDAAPEPHGLTGRAPPRPP
eukprot:4142794-Pyramimonas_sp.AAC.1